MGSHKGNTYVGPPIGGLKKKPGSKNPDYQGKIEFIKTILGDIRQKEIKLGPHRGPLTLDHPPGDKKNPKKQKVRPQISSTFSPPPLKPIKKL